MTLRIRRYRPSQAHYWSRCAAQPRFTEHLPEELSGDAAREGTCAAWVAELVLQGRLCDEHQRPQPAKSAIGLTHENGWIVTDEMADYVQQHVDKVLSIGSTVEAEEMIRASDSPLIEGTLDTSVCAVVSGILHIIDLKYGRRIVEALFNPQLTIYGKGKLLKLPVGAIREIHMSIYQPRAFHTDGIFRTWKVTPDELEAEFQVLLNAARACDNPNSVATPGPHCMDCKAASSCESLAHTTYYLVEKVLSRKQRTMESPELSRELDFIDDTEKTILARFKAVKAEAEARAKKESIPGWSLKQKTGNRAFTVGGTTVQLITGVNPWENKLCTPAALERKEVPKDVVNKLSKIPVTGHKLTRMKRGEIAAIFKNQPSH